jgi:DsbC/DsbD-like thiol-disulfide interchange protein
MLFGNSCSRLPVLAVLLCLPALWPQSPTNERLTVGQPQKVAGKRNETVHTKIPISILAGYHVNSNTPSEDYLIPLSLTWSALGPLEGGQVAYPKPTLEKYEFAEKPLSVFTGNFELAVSFKVAATAAAGPGVAAGKLRYQACSNKACFQPKTVEVTVPYSVQ